MHVTRETVSQHFNASRATETEALAAHRTELLGIIEDSGDCRDFDRLRSKVEALATAEGTAADFAGNNIFPRETLFLIYEAFGTIRESAKRPQQTPATLATRQTGARLLNDFLWQASGLATDDSSTAHEGRYTPKANVDTCYLAETYFTSAKNQIVDRGATTQTRVSVYHDDHGEPLLLRKSREVSSALTLVPVDLDGFRLPAGSIVGVDKTMPAQLSGQKVRPLDELNTYQIDGPLQLTPGRISAWAYEDPMDRALFSVTGHPPCPAIDTGRANAVAQISLNDFRESARQIMSLCQTELHTPASEG